MFDLLLESCDLLPFRLDILVGIGIGQPLTCGGKDLEWTDGHPLTRLFDKLQENVFRALNDLGCVLG